MVATERSGRVTGRVEASGQESAVGRAATLQAVTRVKPEQASKVKSWMPTRLLTGEGRANGEETDKHLFGPPGYWARHAGKVICVIGGDPGLVEVAPPTLSTGWRPSRKSERVTVPQMPGNAGGGKDPYFRCAFEEGEER
jgi:hypothetical protein